MVNTPEPVRCGTWSEKSKSFTLITLKRTKRFSIKISETTTQNVFVTSYSEVFLNVSSSIQNRKFFGPDMDRVLIKYDLRLLKEINLKERVESTGEESKDLLRTWEPTDRKWGRTEGQTLWKGRESLNWSKLYVGRTCEVVLPYGKTRFTGDVTCLVNYV